MWYLDALASAVFATARKTTDKKLSQTMNHFTLGAAMQAFALPLVAVMLLTRGTLLNPMHLPVQFWLANLAIWIGFFPLNTYFYLSAYKHGELSKVLPLQSLGNGFSLFLGWKFLHQHPTPLDLLAMLIVVAGIYILNMNGNRLHSPLSIVRDRANRHALYSIGLGSSVSLFDAIGIRSSNALYFSFVSTTGAVIVLSMIAWWSGVRTLYEVRQNLKELAVAGTCMGGSLVAIMYAIASGPLGYIGAVRSSGIIAGSVIGMWYFGEQVSRNKVVALAMTTAGVVLLGM